MDDDFFAERTGWISSDDGLLAVDRNADGVIDDIAELFGGNNPDGIEQTGFAALSDFDSNLDGIVDASDTDFDKLLVWRDLDGDGTGESGEADGFGRELFTLEELGISAISTGSTAFDESTGDTENGRIIASGATLLSEGTYTRTDGSTGAVYEVIFETDTTRTIYRGDNGLATWSPTIATGPAADVAINATGRGRMADMAISAANDPALAAVITAQLAQMGVAAGAAPDLATLRDLAAPVVSAWAAADPLSRELTPTLVSTDGTTLLDTGVYVEDASGGYWTLASGADVLAAGGAVIARASLADVLAQNAGGGNWQLEQLWSPSNRAEAVTVRPDAPYLVEQLAV